MDYVEESLYFSRDELKCKHTGECEMDPEFLDHLDTLRERVGRPLYLSSAYRDISHPAEARKGEGNYGAHAHGKAADIECSRSEAHEILREIMDMGVFTGVGIQQKGAGRFIHIDTMTKEEGFNRPTVWSY